MDATAAPWWRATWSRRRCCACVPTRRCSFTRSLKTPACGSEHDASTSCTAHAMSRTCGIWRATSSAPRTLCSTRATARTKLATAQDFSRSSTTSTKQTGTSLARRRCAPLRLSTATARIAILIWCTATTCTGCSPCATRTRRQTLRTPACAQALAAVCSRSDPQVWARLYQPFAARRRAQ